MGNAGRRFIFGEKGVAKTFPCVGERQEFDLWSPKLAAR